jgi:predicted alpha-1,2-mannosidase
MYKEGGRLPVWELDSNETWCMIGNHSIPVIADACLHGNPDFSVEEAYQAMKATVNDTIRGMKAFQKYGYVPYNVENNSVSITVEYAYDDWCVAQVAKKLGKMADYKYFMKQAGNFANLYNPATGFLQGKNTQGEWRKNFNPIDVSRLGSDDFTEGNSWQYTFFAPQDVDGLIHLIGGTTAFAQKLDSMFNQPSVNNNPESPDVSGMIGQYSQGNEPSHQIAYMYNFVGEPFRTAERVRLIADSLYNDTREGLCGNDDCGQMSAWYVFSTMGFYPVNPASGVYEIGSPLFPKVVIHTGNAKDFTIEAKNVSTTNKYIQSATMNGKPYPYSYITIKQIGQGSMLLLNMGDKPSKWGTQLKDRPVSKIPETGQQ